ncbi:MAG: DUF86 domain-containing protein, partial [Thermoplasmatota archaeon]
MIDEELIEAKIDIILTNYSYLETVRSTDKTDFLGSFEKKQATKHSLQEAIEASLDIANHFIAEQGWNRAETYAEMFQELYKHQIIDKSLMESLSDMARFRNLLMHRYATIDEQRVWSILQEDLDDFALYVKKIESFLQ